MGFFKKMVVADNLAAIVAAVYHRDTASGGAVLIATYAFAYQIYCDFSGYTDIARGAAKLMGFELMLNFKQPYSAENPSDFWRRWHISLSTWLRDYLYIPLGGSRGTRLLTYRNLMLTMLLGGLWHGASWNFVLWGAFHGALLVVHRLVVTEWRFWTFDGPIARAASRMVMFHLTCYGWLLFRAESFGQIVNFTGALFTGVGAIRPLLSWGAPLVAFVLLLWSVELWVGNADDPSDSPGWTVGLGPLVSTALLLALVMLTPPGTQSFIYFQF